MQLESKIFRDRKAAVEIVADVMVPEDPDRIGVLYVFFILMQRIGYSALVGR